MKRSYTQDDVARLAGVSRSVVSLVINNRDDGRVSPETRQRVLQAIRELGYAPNPAARMLAQKRSYLIGVFTYEELFPHDVDDFFHPFLVGVEHQASLENYDLLLFTRKGDFSTRSIYRNGMNILNMVDGAVLMGSRPNEDEIRDLVRDEHPFVYIGSREIEGCEFDWVSSDYRQGAYDAVRHLLELGHRRIGGVGLKPQGAPHRRNKAQGTIDAVSEVAGASLALLPDEFIHDGAALMEEVLRQELTALVCDSNITMLRVMHQLYPLEISIPEELSVIALSDERVNLPGEYVPSTVHLNRPRVGREAVKLLVSRLNGHHKEPTHRLIPCRFVLGNTSGPVPDKGRRL